jgi:hypothetical protein
VALWAQRLGHSAEVIENPRDDGGFSMLDFSD